MRFLRTLLMAGTSTLAITNVALAQGQASPSKMASCSDIRNQLEAEVNQINKGGTWKAQFDGLMQQARQARDPAQCLDTLQRANRLVARETGDQPIGSGRFRMARDASGVSGSRGKQERVEDSARSPAAGSGSQQSSMVEDNAKRVNVAYADEIVDTKVIDMNGEEVGEIEYLVIDTAEAKIKVAVLGSGGVLDMGEELTAVPWQQLNARMHRGQPSVELIGTADIVKQGRRLRRDELDQLTNVTYQTQVIRYWVPTMPRDNESGTGQRSGGTASQAAGAQDSTTAQSDNAQQNQQRSTGGDQQPSRQARASQSGKSGQSGQSGTAGSQSDTMILAGREFITVLMPSSLKTGHQLRGATAESSDGQELGEIDRLVLDTSRGYVAYALVAQGGFLGLGEEWRPVPADSAQLANRGDLHPPGADRRVAVTPGFDAL